MVREISLLANYKQKYEILSQILFTNYKYGI